MSNIKSLTHILPLAIILLGLVSYNFMNAQWTAAPANPPASNAAAPVNIGTASQVKNGALGVNGLSINSSYPTIAFVDPKVGSRLLYLQPSSNRFYFLGDRNGDGAVVWADDRPEALSIYLGATTSQDFTYVSNQVRAAQYCDAAGLNCFSAVAVAPSVANVDNIVYNVHTKAQCTAAGGTVFDSGSVFICKFTGVSCPVGWTQYLKWNQTQNTTCSGGGCGFSCTTTSHSLNNYPSETCTYMPHGQSQGECDAKPLTTCTATITHVGCY